MSEKEKVDHLMEAQKALTPKMRTPEDCFTIDTQAAYYHLLCQIVENEGRQLVATEALVEQVRRVANAHEVRRPRVGIWGYGCPVHMAMTEAISSDQQGECEVAVERALGIARICGLPLRPLRMDKEGNDGE